MAVNQEVPILNPFYLELFLKKVEVTRDIEECWLWTGALGGRKAYGTYKAGHYGRQHAAHVWSYRYFVGPIPLGYDVHHKCYVTRCVNWYHLELKTPFYNSIDRSDRRWYSSETCSNGHKRSPENTYVDPRGWRECALCRKEASRRYYLSEGVIL